MSKAKNSLGTVFSVETETPETYIKIEEIIDIPSLLGDESGDIDVTSMDSVGYTESISDGLKKAPSITVQCNYTGGPGQQRIAELAISEETIKFKLVLPDKISTEGTTIIRNGYIKSRNLVPGKGKQMILEFKIQFSGAPVETAAS